MYSFPHFLISVSLGGILAILLRPSLPSSVLVVYTGILGVTLDLDHFPIARWNAGDWAALRGVLAHPQVVLLDQDAIFEEHLVWPLQRLLTHLGVGSFLVVVLLSVSGTIAFVSAVIVYANILTDLIYENIRHDQYLRRCARFLAEHD